MLEIAIRKRMVSTSLALLQVQDAEGVNKVFEPDGMSLLHLVLQYTHEAPNIALWRAILDHPSFPLLNHRTHKGWTALRQCLGRLLEPERRSNAAARMPPGTAMVDRGAYIGADEAEWLCNYIPEISYQRQRATNVTHYMALMSLLLQVRTVRELLMREHDGKRIPERPVLGRQLLERARRL